MCVFVSKQIITQLVVLHTFLFSPPPRGRGKPPPFLFQNSQNYFTLTPPPPVPQRDGVASLRYALNAPDYLAARGAAVIAWFT